MSIDPKRIALRKFVEPDPAAIEVTGRYATDPPILTQSLLDAVAERAPRDGAIAEFGFGSGWLLEEVQRAFPAAALYGLDMSAGSVRRAQRLYGPSVRVLIGDMEELPFRERSFDVVLTCWTLYFMRDIDDALDEIIRCLRPGGRLIAATVASENEVELGQLVAEAVRESLGHRVDEPDVARRFDIETGAEYMDRHFRHVELREWRGEMVLPDARHARELWNKWRPRSLAADETEAAFAHFERLLAQRIERDGSMRIRRHSGAFVADLTS